MSEDCALASIYVADFTRDHVPELLGFCPFQNQALVFPGRSDGSFAGAIPSSLPALAFVGNLPLGGLTAGPNAAIGDFNRDGNPDIGYLAATPFGPRRAIKVRMNVGQNSNSVEIQIK